MFMFSLYVRFDNDPFSLIDEIGIYSTVCCHHHNPNDLCKAKFDSGGFDKVYIDMVWAFICE